MHDRTEKRIPLKLGLDLQGGMHLALELDQTKQVSADPARDLDLALTVLRKRIDEFGVSEPVIQKVGDERHRGGASWHRRPRAGQEHRAAERLPGVPDHRRDQRPGEGDSGDGSGAAPDGHPRGGRRARQAVRRRAAAGRRHGKHEPRGRHREEGGRPRQRGEERHGRGGHGRYGQRHRRYPRRTDPARCRRHAG